MTSICYNLSRRGWGAKTPRSATPWPQKKPGEDGTTWKEYHRPTTHVVDFEYPNLRPTLAAARKILALEPDFDGYGTVPFSRETWQRSYKFLRGMLVQLREGSDVDLEPPMVSVGENASVEFYWSTPTFELLITIPEDVKERASFLGRNLKRGARIVDTFDPTSYHPGLIAWIVNRTSEPEI